MLQKARCVVNSPCTRQLLLKCASSFRLTEHTCTTGTSHSCQRSFSSEANVVTSTAQEDAARPKEKVSKAMRAYLERARDHDEFMQKQRAEFQIGKRHLANMMGVDADTMTQKDIDRAIEFLFPSGLFERQARPLMRPPEEVFPQRKAAEFDETGRPHHHLFYTMSSNFYQIMQDAVTLLEELNKDEDAMIRKRGQAEEGLQLDVSGSEWVTKEVLEKMLVERVSDSQYTQFQAVLDRVLEHPLSSKTSEFIKKYRKALISQNKTHDIPKPLYDSEGRAYVTVNECLRKTARAVVTIRMPGTGKFTINSREVDYFSNIQSREQLLFPLIFTALVERVDVEATVTGGGPTGQAGAIRWGLSWGLRSFVDTDMVDRMRLAGLLTRDYRILERQKPGQAGARKKYTWKKR